MQASKLQPRVLFLLFAVTIVVASSFFQAIFVYDQAGALDHRGRLYFTNRSFTTIQQDCPVIYGGYHGGNSHTAFIAKIKLSYAYSSTSGCRGVQDRGAAYIVKTMLGKGVGQSPTVSSSEWAEWEQKVRATTMVQSSFNVRNQINTAAPYRSGVQDVGQFTDTRNVSYPTTVFRNSSGTAVYTFKNACGNPVGRNSALPPAINYNLTPTISGNPAFAESGSSVSLSPTVSNSGSTTSSSVRSSLTRFQLGTSDSVPTGGSTSTPPIAHYGNGASQLSSENITFARGNNVLSVGAQTMPDLPIGDRVCYGLSVQPRAHNSSQWRHSTPFCVTIAKTPKIHVLGGDVIVGENSADPDQILTSTTRKSVSGANRTFGSWGEYAVSATGSIAGMASGAGYSGGATGVNFCTVSYLTLTNAGSSVCGPSSPKGNFDYGTGLPNISARFGDGQSLGNVASVNLSAQSSGVYSTNRNINVNASSDIGVGQWVVINAPNQTVNITGDIRYTGAPLSSAADIPQIIIIANRINIRENVENVDAWLIASGTNGIINTCSQITNPLTQLDAGRCDDRLTVNGPIAARQLLLYRTAGAGTGSASGNPAEVFNLRPDAYLWATYYSSTAGRIQTVSTQELPPRF